MATEHPARAASQRSMEMVGRKGVFTYEVDAEGKILSLTAFWELEQTVVKTKKP